MTSPLEHWRQVEIHTRDKYCNDLSYLDSKYSLYFHALLKSKNEARQYIQQIYESQLAVIGKQINKWTHYEHVLKQQIAVHVSAIARQRQQQEHEQQQRQQKLNQEKLKQQQQQHMQSQMQAQVSSSRVMHPTGIIKIHNTYHFSKKCIICKIIVNYCEIYTMFTIQ